MSIDVDVTDGIATITINRPERMNAMDAEHYKGLSQAWMRVRDDAAIRVAIITGAGEKSFSSGADIKSFLTSPAGLDEMWLTQRDQLLNRGLEVWKPVIAAVNGYCLAGGMTLAARHRHPRRRRARDLQHRGGEARHPAGQWRHAAHPRPAPVRDRHGAAAHRRRHRRAEARCTTA